MGYCGPHDVPYEDFVEDWSPLSREAALAWHEHDRARCNKCGTHPADWDPERGGSEFAFVAVSYVCPGCKALHDAPATPKDQPFWHTILVPGDLVAEDEKRKRPDTSVPFTERTRLGRVEGA